jgi:hypothetical protein
MMAAMARMNIHSIGYECRDVNGEQFAAWLAAPFRDVKTQSSESSQDATEVRLPA